MSYNTTVYAMRCILIRLAEFPVCSYHQVLDVGRKRIVNTCTVLLFLRELTQHESEGFINPSVWQDLRLHVHPDVFPAEVPQHSELPTWTRSKFPVAITNILFVFFQPSSYAGR